VPLTLRPLLVDAGIDLSDALVIRHAFVLTHEDSGMPGIQRTSTTAEILEYTRRQSASTQRFPARPPRFWVVFVKERGDQARLWSVVENRGELSDDGIHRTYDLVETEHMAELRGRLVIGWRSPRTWWMRANTAGAYPVAGIADAEPLPFPGFDSLVLDYAHLQAVMREPRYTSWRTSVSGGARTRPTGTAATNGSSAVTRPASAIRFYACSIRRRLRPWSTKQRAITRRHSARVSMV
jgi:hypothetical protein